MNKIKVAVIGYGHLGKWHVEKALKLDSLYELVGVVEVNPETQKRIKESNPQLKIVSTIDEMLPFIEAAFVVTPTSFHYEVVKKLLENKKNVFCEKPLCSTVAQAKELVLAAQSLKLQVGHSERCHAVWEKWKPHFQNDTCTKIIRMNRVASFKGRATDVDVVQDLMIHDLDLLLYLFKEKPISVNAQGFKIRTKNWDHVTAQISFNQGTKAYITVSRNHVKEIRDMEVTSCSGCYYVDLMNNQNSFATNTQNTDGSFVENSSDEKRDHLLMEHELFYRSLIENKPTFVTANEGLNAIILVESVLQSLQTSQEVKINL